MEYRVDDRSLTPDGFLAFVDQIWPGDYDAEKTRTALARTLNITARDGGQLVGCLRILTDGCFFGTITELLVLPAYQQRGIGSRLLQLAGTHTPTLLYFGTQPGAEAFYRKTAAGGACRPSPSDLRRPARRNCRKDPAPKGAGSSFDPGALLFISPGAAG